LDKLFGSSPGTSHTKTPTNLAINCFCKRSHDAALRNLELIGEAATQVPEYVRAAHSQIPWRLVIAPRNRLIHGYLGIGNDVLWTIIEDDISSLLAELRRLEATLG